MAKSRRQILRETRAKPEQLDPTPIEIPVDARREGNSVRDQIQREIAMQLAKKAYGPVELGADEILAELRELEVDDQPDLNPSFSQYEYENMPDELLMEIDGPGEEVIPEGEVQPPENQSPSQTDDPPLSNTEPPPAA